MPTPPAQIELLGLTLPELEALVQSWGQPEYRAKQIFDALYRRRASDFGKITTLPASLRQQLTEQGYVARATRIERKFTSSDGTVRYLMAFADGESVETVWMPEGDGGEAGDGSAAAAEAESSATTRQGTWDRATICVSSQVGCAVNCQFCLTAQLGMQRNLTAGEIVGQILTVLDDQQVPTEGARINLVFMGQGEPFLNYENFMQAVRLLVEGAGIAESRMTVSTAGIVPRIYDFGQEPVRPKLAISLNAPNDELRSRIMPLNRKWDLASLTAAVREFPLRNREKLTFEYVLLEGENDSPEQAREVLELIRGIRCKVNLIALNPGHDLPFSTPAQPRVLDFQEILTRGGVPAFIRRPRGRDIFAACGQLRKTVLSSPVPLAGS